MNTPTANSLLGLSAANFSSRVKNMPIDEYTKVLNTIDQESKRQAFIRRFGDPTNSTLKNRLRLVQTRKITSRGQPLGKGPNTYQTVLNRNRRDRAAATAAPATAAPATAAPPQQLVAPPPQALGKGVQNYRRDLNERRKEKMNARPPSPPSTGPRKAQITTFANLAEREGKKIFVNVSYIPVNGNRKFTNKLEGVSSIEKKECPVLVKQDQNKGYALSVKVGESTNLLLPMPIPEMAGGKIVTVPKNIAKQLLNEQKEPKKISIQHSFLKDNKGVYSISYEANLYEDEKKSPFFYYLNQQELKENGNDGIPMYDVPGVSGDFLVNE
jgi:hypothetical protein